MTDGNPWDQGSTGTVARSVPSAATKVIALGTALPASVTSSLQPVGAHIFTRTTASRGLALHAPTLTLRLRGLKTAPVALAIPSVDSD